MQYLFLKVPVTFTVWNTVLRGKEDNSNYKIFRIQKRVIRSMVGVNSRTSCKQLFKEIKILMLTSLYIYILEVTSFIKKISSVSGAKL
jgi:hypothetical protein